MLKNSNSYQGSSIKEIYTVLQDQRKFVKEKSPNYLFLTWIDNKFHIL